MTGRAAPRRPVTASAGLGDRDRGDMLYFVVLMTSTPGCRASGRRRFTIGAVLLVMLVLSLIRRFTGVAR
jgi:hypothetical protein